MSETFEVVKLTSKGQMTLPVKARKKLGLKKGDHLAVYVENNKLVLRKFFPLKQATPQDAIFGLLGQWEGPADLAEKHDQYLADAVGEFEGHHTELYTGGKSTATVLVLPPMPPRLPYISLTV